MATIRKIGELPTPRVPLLKGAYVAPEWQAYLNSIKISREDIVDALLFFKTISCPAGDSVVADTNEDTLTLLSGTSDLTITGDASADSITLDLIYALLNGAGSQLITGAWQIPKLPSVTYTDVDATLTTDDLGKVVKMDNNANHVVCNLPSVGIDEVDKWVTIMKLGAGEVLIQAADSDVIETSSAGGYVVCDEINRVAANLKLYLAEQTKWAILGGTGIWKVV